MPLSLLSLSSTLGYYAPPCALAAPGRAVQFEYASGSVEAPWATGDGHGHGQLCCLARKQRGSPIVDAWLNYSARAVGNAPGRSATEQERAALSSMRCTDGSMRLLEPLTGFARHPMASLCKGFAKAPRRKFDITYLVPENQCNRAPPILPSERSTAGASVGAGCGGRNIFFDLGSSSFDGTVDLRQGWGLGPSIPLLCVVSAASAMHE